MIKNVLISRKLLNPHKTRIVQNQNKIFKYKSFHFMHLNFIQFTFSLKVMLQFSLIFIQAIVYFKKKNKSLLVTRKSAIPMYILLFKQTTFTFFFN